MKIEGVKDQFVMIGYSEILHEDGTINQDYLKAAELSLIHIYHRNLAQHNRRYCAPAL